MIDLFEPDHNRRTRREHGGPDTMPRIFLIGGPNGAGKTTSAMSLLPAGFDCEEYVNADAIAAGLSPFRPQSVTYEAARLMLERVRSLAEHLRDFAFETTMASRSFVPFLRQCRSRGYFVHLLFLWLNSPDLAVMRVTSRVKSGGHDVPEDTVRRRYVSGVGNFLNLYIPLADGWTCYDNSAGTPLLVARGGKGEPIQVSNPSVWDAVREVAR